MTVDQHRVRSFDGLRGWAAVVVLIHHLMLLDPWFGRAQSALSGLPDGNALQRAFFYSPLHIVAAGSEAVAVFFVLSGAVLATAFPGRATLHGAYLLPRLTRLYLPIFGAVFLALSLSSLRPEVGRKGMSPWLADYLKAMQWPDVVAQPTALLRELFVLAGTSWLDAPLWSMQVEIAVSILFYAVWTCSTRGLFGFLFAVAIAVVFRHSSISWLTANLAYFVVGAALVRASWRASFRQANALYALGILLFTLPWITRGVGVDIAYGLLGNVWMIAGSTCFVAAAMSKSAVTPALEGRVATFLGQRSYSLYLIHVPVISVMAFWAMSLGDGDPNWGFWVWPCGLAAMVAAEVFFRGIERPAHRMSSRLRKRMTAPNPTAS